MSLVLNALGCVNSCGEQFQSSLWYRNTTSAIDFSQEINLKLLVELCCGALGFPNILPQPLSVYKTEGASLRSQGNRDLLFGVKKAGAISGDVLSPGCSGSMVG